MSREPKGQHTPSITVAPPSGRLPRPISSGDHDELCLSEPLRVTYHYPVSYVRPGRKTSRRVWIRDHQFIQAWTATRPETTLAYRVIWPDPARIPTDVLEFDNSLWWSINAAKPAERFFAALAAGDPSAVSLLGNSLVPIGKCLAALEAINGCRVVEDGRIEAAAVIPCGALDLLVVDGQVFIRDGEPVYIVWNSFVDPKLTTRACHELVKAVHGIDADLGYDDLTTALTFGQIFTPTELEQISALVHNSNLERHATIEVVGVPKVASDPLEIQTDAAFRKLLCLAAVPRRLPRVAAGEVRQQFRKLQQAADASSTARARAMETYLAWMEHFPWVSSFRVEQRFVRHIIDHINAEGIRRDIATPFTPLSEEEDTIIAGLG